MRNHLLTALLVAFVAGCAGDPSGDTAQSAADGSRGPGTSYGHAVVAVLGTPFYVALKAPVCLVSIAIAAPLAGVSGLAEGRMGRSVIRRLGEGVGTNCGPPYVLTPSSGQ